jgi:probable HAF family extracellular repeat protein
MMLPSRRFSPTLILAVLVTLALAPGRTSAAAVYTITDLGSRYVTGLNDSGQVVGKNQANSPTGAPFLYQNGAFTDLSNKIGASAWITGINNTGQIVGSTPIPGVNNGDAIAINDAAGGSNGFVLNPNGQLTAIAPPATGSLANVVAINNNGDTLVQSGSHVSLNQNGKITDLSVVTQGQPLVTGLSDAGHVIGFGPSAFVYQNGTTTNLGSLGGGSTQTEVWGVNAAGQVVGFSSTTPTNPGDTIHAFLYQNGKMADLGTLGGSRSWGWGLNSHGQVIGMSDYLGGSSNIPTHAFLYKDGTMFDLNTLVPTGSGWILEYAKAINAQGQIIGGGIGPDGQSHAFLLTPAVSEPSTLTFFGLAATVLGVRQARRRQA